MNCFRKAFFLTQRRLRSVEPVDDTASWLAPLTGTQNVLQQLFGKERATVVQKEEDSCPAERDFLQCPYMRDVDRATAWILMHADSWETC